MKRESLLISFVLPALLLPAMFSSCTSIPSTHKLSEGRNYSVGITVQINYFNNHFVPTINLDGRKRLNEFFDVGLSLTPGITINTFAPYIVASRDVTDKTQLVSFVQIPTRINLNFLVFNVGNDSDALSRIKFDSGINLGVNAFYSLSSTQMTSIGGRIDTTRLWITDSAENIFGKAGSPYLINIIFSALPSDSLVINSILEADTKSNVSANSEFILLGKE